MPTWNVGGLQFLPGKVLYQAMETPEDSSAPVTQPDGKLGTVMRVINNKLVYVDLGEDDLVTFTPEMVEFTTPTKSYRRYGGQKLGDIGIEAGTKVRLFTKLRDSKQVVYKAYIDNSLANVQRKEKIFR